MDVQMVEVDLLLHVKLVYYMPWRLQGIKNSLVLRLNHVVRVFDDGVVWVPMQLGKGLLKKVGWEVMLDLPMQVELSF